MRKYRQKESESSKKSEIKDGDNKDESKEANKVRNKSDMGTILKLISWAAFALTLIPFLPQKLAIGTGGIIAGYLYKENHNGDKMPFLANVIMMIVRLVMWALILIAL